jgi:hypothetical protein
MIISLLKKGKRENLGEIDRIKGAVGQMKIDFRGGVVARGVGATRTFYIRNVIL